MPDTILFIFDCMSLESLKDKYIPSWFIADHELLDVYIFGYMLGISLQNDPK